MPNSVAPGKKQRSQEKQNRKESGQHNQADALPACFPHFRSFEMASASRDFHRFRVIEFGLHYSGRLVPLVRLPLHCVKNNLLELFGDLRIHFARSNRSPVIREFITTNGFGPSKGTEPVVIS